MENTIGNLNLFIYRSYCYDSDIQLYYLQSRYYDPEICRFINADDTQYLGATGTVLSYNLFAYCENDPVDFVDYSGFVSSVFAVSMKRCINKTTKKRTEKISLLNGNVSIKLSITYETGE